MQISRKFKIKGIGISLPATKITSEELEAKLKLPDNWIAKRLGVKNRYQVEKESNTSLGVEALTNALDDAQLQVQDIDLLIGASATFDYVLPNRSALIKAQLSDAHDLHFPCMDINTVCTSFISAMEYASHVIASGQYKTVAIVTSEIASKGLNPEDVKTFCLFGDAAASIILQNTDEARGAIHFQQRTYSEGVEQTMIQGGGNQFHPRDYIYDPALHSFKMEGKSLLRSANKYIPEYFVDFFDTKEFSWTDIQCVIPHQASNNGMKILYGLDGIDREKVIDILALYGNCIAASIPLGLYHAIRENRLKRGENCLIAGTAAGMSITGLLFTY